MPAKLPHEDPTPIIPGLLYISNVSVATKTSLLRSKKIAHVINLCADLGVTQAIYSDDIELTLIPAIDMDGYDILQHLDVVMARLEEASRNGTGVLVHCAAGINRSGALVVAAYMKHTQTPLLKAVAHVKDRRRYLLWNPDFRRQLVEWARTQGLDS